VSFDILSIKDFRQETNAIDIAFPVVAYECEVKSQPDENALDAYEEVMLKLVEVGLSTNSINKTLGLPAGLAKQILSQLDARKLIEFSTNKYVITKDGEKTLKCEKTENISASSKYGFMFVGSIRKNILPYFYEGDIDKVPYANYKNISNSKLTINGDEYKTLELTKPNAWQFSNAYGIFRKLNQYAQNGERGKFNTNTKEIEEELPPSYFQIENDFEEFDYDAAINIEKETPQSSGDIKNGSVRLLNREPLKMYLQLRIIIDLTELGGFRVISPVELGGLDNDFYNRELSWMFKNNNNIYFGEESFYTFISREINKLGENISTDDESVDVKLQRLLPHLVAEKTRYADKCEYLLQIFELMKRKDSNLINKKNVVRELSSELLEWSFDKLIRTVNADIRRDIKFQAKTEYGTYGDDNVVKTRWLDTININGELFESTKAKTATDRLDFTFGNSIMEKLLNIIAIHYYRTSPQISKFISHDNLSQLIKDCKTLNVIRNKTSHSGQQEFTKHDYDEYIGKVFNVTETILESIKEAQ
jgi:hypothetical protein